MGQPNFIVAGFERCGTTMLYESICRHSQVVPAYQKELEFFNRHYDKGYGWYENQFQNNQITGEATPAYVWHPLVAQRIMDYLPFVKIILIKRDAARAVYSRYWQQVARGNEKMSLKKVLEFEEIRIKGDIERALLGNYYPVLYAECAYTQRYKYEIHIKQWLKMKNVLILNHRDNIMKNVFNFLGLKNEAIIPQRINTGIDYPPMTEEIREMINHYLCAE